MEIEYILTYLGATNLRGLWASDKTPETQDELNNYLNKITYESSNEITWEVFSAAKEPVNKKIGLEIIRKWRNEKLKDTDWIMTTDNTDSLLNKDEWYTYRQALRDLPESIQTFIFKEFPHRLDIDAMNLPQQPLIKRKPNQPTTQ